MCVITRDAHGKWHRFGVLLVGRGDQTDVVYHVPHHLYAISLPGESDTLGTLPSISFWSKQGQGWHVANEEDGQCWHGVHQVPSGTFYHRLLPGCGALQERWIGQWPNITTHLGNKCHDLLCMCMIIMWNEIFEKGISVLMPHVWCTMWQLTIIWEHSQKINNYTSIN